MKTLAFTFVQNDLVGLRLWLSYYTRYFDDLNVYCFNTKEEHRKDLDELKREYNFVYEFLYEYEGNKIDGTPAVLLGFIKDIQNTFLGDHDWILCCNLDEIFISKRGNLKDLMEKHKNELVALPSEGYDVIQAEDEKPIDYSKPLFEQRKYMVKNPNYNKIVLTRVPLNWVAGLHKIDSMTDDESRAIKNTGLYLIHLKHADLQRKREVDPFTVPLDSRIMEHKPEDRIRIPKYFRKLL